MLNKKLDVIAGLEYIHTVERINKTFVDERWVGFTWQLELLPNLGVDVTSNLGIGRGDGKIINLSTKENRNTLDGGMVNVLLMSSRLKTKFGIVQDGVDVFFPETSSFGVSLQGI
jgi:hypothetical protein